MCNDECMSNTNINIIQNNCRNVQSVAKSSELLAVGKLLEKNLKTLMPAQNVIFKSQVRNTSLTLIVSLILLLLACDQNSTI